MKRANSLAALLDKVVNIPVLQIIILIIVFTLISMFSLSSVEAQEPSTDNELSKDSIIVPLKIGDTIPKDLWNLPLTVANHPDGKEKMILKEYREKLIILDFWATWCGACIGSIQKYLKTEAYKDPDIAFIGITDQDEEEITKFNNRFKLNFLTVLDDRVLRSYFPHRIIPHIIVLKDGKVQAITHPEILQPENIQALKDGTNNKELIKNDILDFDKTKEILSQPNSRVKDAIRTRTVVLGFLPGLPSQSSHKKNAREQRVFVSNQSALQVMYDLLPVFWRNRIFLDVEHNDRFDYLGVKNKQQISYTQWLMKYGVSVESIAPLDVPKEVFFKNTIISMLNAIGFDFYNSEKKLQCQFIYPKIARKKRQRNVGANIAIEKLLYLLNNQPSDLPRVPIYLCDSKLNKLDSIRIDLLKIRDPEYLRVALLENGLGIKQIISVQSIIEVKERRQQ